MLEAPRVLTPKGEILKLIIVKPRTSSEIAKKLYNIAKPTVYRGIRDLLIAGWVRSNKRTELYKATKDGVKAFWSAILGDELADRLVRINEKLNVSTYNLVELGVRLILDVVEYGVLSGEVRRLIERYDPSLVKLLTKPLFREIKEEVIM